MRKHFTFLLLVAFSALLSINSFSQVTSLTIEPFYTDDGSIAGYPAGHTTYHIYANTTGSNDRVVGVSGVAANPMSLNVTGSGVWNYIPGGVVGDDATCSIYATNPLAEYDSYLTIGYTCDNDGGAGSLYNVDDPAGPWMDEMFNTEPYGSISSILVNTVVGATWFTLPTNSISAGGAENKVLIAQITTNGNICGIVNLQVFPNYSMPGDPYVMQNGLEFGDNTDPDGDGYTGCEGDCDNNDNSVYPGAVEVCNSIDDNCDGNIDEGLLTTYYLDNDGDGYGDPASSSDLCSATVGYVLDNTDCNDSNNLIYPGATEICNTADDNCDGNVDEGQVQLTYYADDDGDGFGNPDVSMQSCMSMEGFVEDNTDCNDNSADINPMIVETCNGIDDDCSGNVDDGLTFLTYYEDADGDGFGNPEIFILSCTTPEFLVLNDQDCDDNNADVNPGISEACNAIDDDCDGNVDEGTLITSYADDDGDGYGNPEMSMITCVMPIGYVSDNTDCDDTNASISPGMLEVCNGVDDNCDGSLDEGFSPQNYYADNDGDSYGNPADMVVSCDPVVGYVTDNTDCDDNNVDVNPSIDEACNGIDDNCDGTIDEGFTLQTFYNDTDGDGFGNDINTTLACAAPLGYSALGGDCDDNDQSINPGTPEICNNVDDNCNETIDEGIVFSTFYMDADNDGYGDLMNFIEACSQPIGYVTDSSDCDDTKADVNPGVAEACNDIDDNCDGNIDEGLTINTYFADEDGDGYGNSEISVDDCTAPDGYVTDATDCNDASASVYPGAAESCDNTDEDCDGMIDNDVVYQDYFEDIDGDGFGGLLFGNFCSNPGGYVLNNLDCDDNNGAINPDATDVCNSIDDNCDGLIDEDATATSYYNDTDGDGFGGTYLGDYCEAPANASTVNGDCDDNNASTYPGATEYCNEVDDDCNGTTDENIVFVDYYTDMDGDGFGDTFLGNLCFLPDNSSTVTGDCDDNDGFAYPGATEICNATDDDCDGSIDEDIELITYYADNDADGFGGALLGEFCYVPVDATTQDGDCDDNNASVNPLASETCNEIDDNCDGAIDEFQGTIYYADTDSDSFGDPNNTIFECDAPAGFVADNTDCDDTDASVNPNATEIPGNDIDEDCDGDIVDSVSELNTSWNLSLYPNPVNQELQLTVSGVTGTLQYQITDALGKLVLTSQFIAGVHSVKIDCSGLSQGSYHLSVLDGKSRVNTRFVKL